MMKTVDIQMEIMVDNKEKKIKSIQPFGGGLSLPAECVICNRPSFREMPLSLELKRSGITYDYQQTMPYCRKHQIQLTLISILNLMPAFITIGLAVYLFILLGGFAGDGAKFLSSGIFLAFFLGTSLYFLFKPTIRSIRNGTSGTGVSVVLNDFSREIHVEDKLIILCFQFINDQFAQKFARLNPQETQIPPDETSVATT